MRPTSGPLRQPSREPWTCPECGRSFRSANKYHTCGTFPLDGHFSGKEPVVREIYDSLLAALQAVGPVSVFPLKSRIVFQAQVQFAAAAAHRNWLECILWLRRRAGHPRLLRVEMQVYRDYGHILRLDQPSDLDEGLIALLEEAYLIGSALD